MSILSWLKKVTSGDVSAEFMHSQPMQFAQGEEHFHGLNMKEALDAHIAWAHRLEAQLNGGASEELEVGMVATDNRCTLGQWIHGPGRQMFGDTPEFQELKRIHAEFHLCAGEVLNDIQHGQQELARGNIKSIRRKSGDVQLSLVRLYSKAND